MIRPREFYSKTNFILIILNILVRERVCFLLDERLGEGSPDRDTIIAG
jgi:hypothetical protein